MPANQKATEGDLASAIRYETLINGECVASTSVAIISFICSVADTMEDLPPQFQEAINIHVEQSFNDAFNDHIPVGLELMIQTTVTNALAASLPQLLAPINDTLTRMEAKMTRMEAKMTRMETKLTRVQIMLAKASVQVLIHFCCILTGRLNVGLLLTLDVQSIPEQWTRCTVHDCFVSGW